QVAGMVLQPVAARRLDLHHLGLEVAEEHRGHGPRDALAEVGDADSPIGGQGHDLPAALFPRLAVRGMKAGPGRIDKPRCLRAKGEAVMRTATLGPLGEVSRLTLGGGGIGQIWGETTRDEALATLAAAIDGGITVLDA